MGMQTRHREGVFVSAFFAALFSISVFANGPWIPPECEEWFDYLGIEGPFTEVQCYDQGAVCKGTKGNDIIHGSYVPGGQEIRAGFGHDCVIAGPGDHVVHGGFGNDYIDGSSATDLLLLNGSEGYDVLNGGRCADVLVFADECYGGLGIDYIAECETENQGRESIDGSPHCEDPDVPG